MKNKYIVGIIFGILLILIILDTLALPNKACEINNNPEDIRQNLTYPITFGFWDVYCPDYFGGNGFKKTTKFNWLDIRNGTK